MEENYGILRIAMEQIKRNGTALVNQLEKEGRRCATKIVQNILFPLIKDEVLEYFELAHKNSLLVT